MKNISRRVFIKGMAVAAAATAASTVLAGCNLTPVVEEPVAGFQPTTKTLTYGENTLKVTTTSMAITADDYIKVGLTIVNEMGTGVYVFNSNGSNNYLNINAYFDGKHVALAPSAVGEKNLYVNSPISSNSEANGVTSSYTHEGYLYFKPADKDWKTMTLAFVMKGADENSKYSTKEAQIVINK